MFWLVELEFMKLIILPEEESYSGYPKVVFITSITYQRTKTFLIVLSIICIGIIL